MALSLKWWIAGVALVPIFVSACAATRAGYWTPKYTVLERAKGEVPLEIREYPTLTLAATPARSEAEGRDGSFMRLFRFITGKNEEARKIPMTTPVFFRGSGESESMSFVMPENMPGAGGQPAPPPRPTDALVRIEQRAEGTYAVLRMRGRRRADREAALHRLESALLNSAWKAEGPAEYASYDPPWIPSFLRRDEVFLAVKKK